MNRNAKIARKFLSERESIRRLLAFTNGKSLGECNFKRVPKNKRTRKPLTDFQSIVREIANGY